MKVPAKKEKSMKRVKVNILDIAGYVNLANAAVKAARGKHDRSDVRGFFARCDENLNRLRKDILAGNAPYGVYNRFTIYDPKKRTIHAACFEDRVLHHALINYVGPVLERAMVPCTFACRPGKGPLEASQWVQYCTRRFPWYVKMDIKSYFNSIHHNRLIRILERRIKGKEVHKLISRIIESYRESPGRGLPIGSLTSQHFANYYLDGLDRFIMEDLRCHAYARYMDDMIWWCRERQTAKKTLKTVKEWVCKNRLLDLKENPQINRSSRGVTFCGYRIFPGMIRLTGRRRKRYTIKKNQWEKAYLNGLIDERQLQSAYASVYAGTVHADAGEWRKQQLQKYPTIEL
jgi:retron-type reverse transcriptase